MGRALISDPADLSGHSTEFADLYARWRTLVDIAPVQAEAETLAQFEARAEVLGAEFQAVERALLRRPPTEVGEMIALLEVLRRDDALGSDQISALMNFQRALSLQGLRSAFAPLDPLQSAVRF